MYVLFEVTRTLQGNLRAKNVQLKSTAPSTIPAAVGAPFSSVPVDPPPAEITTPLSCVTLSTLPAAISSTVARCPVDPPPSVSTSPLSLADLASDVDTLRVRIERLESLSLRPCSVSTPRRRSHRRRRRREALSTSSSEHLRKRRRKS